MHTFMFKYPTVQHQRPTTEIYIISDFQTPKALVFWTSIFAPLTSSPGQTPSDKQEDKSVCQPNMAWMDPGMYKMVSRTAN